MFDILTHSFVSAAILYGISIVGGVAGGFVLVYLKRKKKK